MKIKQYTGDTERTVLTALIVNDSVLSRIVSGLKGERKPFRSKWSNLIFQWCRDFYLSYSKAPRGALQTLFTVYAEKNGEDATVSLIEKYLVTLSKDYEATAKEMNVDFLVDMASQYFAEIRYTRLKDSMEDGLMRKDVESVEKSLAEFHPISFDAASTVHVFTDVDAWRDAVEIGEDDVLVHYPGALGEFFGPHLQRDGFISFLAPEKRGKSFWLIDMAWRSAVRSKRRTFFFSVGDMSKRQMMQRFVIRATKRPLGAGTVDIPKRIRRTGKGELQIVPESTEFSGRITSQEWRAAQRKIKRLTASSSSLLMMECTSNSTTTVADVRASLDEKIKGGWIPDVVVIDYADILAPEAGAKLQDFRHQTNETWKALRRLSQDYHVLVVTATQSDAASYEARLVTRKNFSEDKRKLSHVTGMVGLNQTEEEKSRGIYRLNWIVLREGVFYEARCVTSAGSLALANPAMLSIW